HHAHAKAGRLPTAGHQPAKWSPCSGGCIHVKRLWIEFLPESDDISLGHDMVAVATFATYLKILPIQHFHPGLDPLYVFVVEQRRPHRFRVECVLLRTPITQGPATTSPRTTHPCPWAVDSGRHFAQTST